jgi:GT2 family glycosyltransferase
MTPVPITPIQAQVPIVRILIVPVLIVIVQYKTPLESAPAIKALDRCFSQDQALLQHFTTLVWDNSPEPHAVPRGISFSLEYRHSSENVGVSGAYNYAAQLASERGAQWLLLLDQDTVLPPEFLSRMRDYAQRLAPRHHIAAVAPTVMMGESRISPKVMVRWGKSVDPFPGFSGEERREVVLVNTGLLLRVEALAKIGGYNPDFWLDFSDRYLCHMLKQHACSVWLAPDLQLQHHVSLMAGGISLKRYANLLDAEDAFFMLYRSLPRNIVYCQRLLRKAWRLRKTNPERARLLCRHLARRFTTSKKQRLRDWRAGVASMRRGMDA